MFMKRGTEFLYEAHLLYYVSYVGWILHDKEHTR